MCNSNNITIINIDNRHFPQHHLTLDHVNRDKGNIINLQCKIIRRIMVVEIAQLLIVEVQARTTIDLSLPKSKYIIFNKIFVGSQALIDHRRKIKIHKRADRLMIADDEY